MGASVPPLRIPIVATGDQAVIGALGRIGNAAMGLERQTAKASLRLASIGTAAIQAGSVGGSALTKLTTIGAELALAFGVGGPVVAAIGIAAITMTSLFTKSREEMKKTREAFEQELGRMQDAGDYAGLEKKARDILYGSPSKNYEDGLAALQTKRRQMQAQLDQAIRDRNIFVVSSLQKGIEKLNQQIKPLREQYDRTIAALTAPDLRPGQGSGTNPVVTTATDHAKALKEQQAAIGKTIGALATLGKFHALEAADVSHLIKLEEQLRKERDQNTASLERRAEIETQRAQISEALQGAFKLDSFGKSIWGQGTEPVIQAPAVTIKMPVRPLTDLELRIKEALERAKENVAQDFAMFGSDVGGSLADALGAGITGGFGAMGEAVLSGLGSIFTRMGKELISYGLLMTNLLPALSNPFTSGPAALAAGAALVALGAALGGIATGRGAPPGAQNVAAAAQSADSITNIRISTGAVDAATGLTPKAPIHVTIMGPGDPVAVRGFAEFYEQAVARGMI